MNGKVNIYLKHSAKLVMERNESGSKYGLGNIALFCLSQSLLQ
jgi:hypothetical protein